MIATHSLRVMSTPLAARAPRYATDPQLRPTRVGGLGQIVCVLLALTGLLELLQAYADVRYRSDLGGMYAAAGNSPSHAHAYLGDINAGLHATAQLLYGLAATATCITFLLWFRRVRANAETLAPGLHRRSPGWAVGGWFIPAANFWIPKQAADDIVEATDPASRSQRLVNVWWTAWVVSVALNTVAALYGSSGSDEASFTKYPDINDPNVGDALDAYRQSTLDVRGWSHALQTAATLEIVGALAVAAAAVVAILVVRSITEAQDTRLNLSR